MGQSQSRNADQEVTDTGVVNSNFIVQEQEMTVNMEVKVLLYVITAILVVNLALKIHKMCKKSMRRRIHQDIAAAQV